MNPYSLPHKVPFAGRCKPQRMALSRLDGVCALAVAVRARKSVGLFECRPTQTHSTPVGRWSKTPTLMGLPRSPDAGAVRARKSVGLFECRPTQTHSTPVGRWSKTPTLAGLVGRWSKTPTDASQTPAHPLAMSVSGPRRTLRVPTDAAQPTRSNPFSTLNFSNNPTTTSQSLAVLN